MSSLNNLPIGSIIFYGGDLSNPETLEALKKAGWLLCDGKSYPQNSYQELFTAIGYSNGGDDKVNFNVPNLCNRFVRGRDSSGFNIDPDSALRTAAASGGATGDNVGSLQKTATKLPKNPWHLEMAGIHTHTVQHLNKSEHETWNGSTYSMARFYGQANTNPNGNHSHTIAGFDSETIPKNIALYFIIKASEPQTSSGDLPSGAIVGFGGPLLPKNDTWLFCDGSTHSKSQYPSLFNIISYNYGGDGINTLNIPDFRGYFLRGTNNGGGNDPDADSRHALHTGGNTGDNIGSAQFGATKSPLALKVNNAGLHSHNIVGIPLQGHDAAKGASGSLAKNAIGWTNDFTSSSSNGEHSHTIIGGDHETRPENVYLDFYIVSNDLSNTAPPIGSIISYSGDFKNNPIIRNKLFDQGWLPCDGATLLIDNYQALYDVIGTTFGSLKLKFSLPDLQGYFIKGAGGETPVGQKRTALSRSDLSLNIC